MKAPYTSFGKTLMVKVRVYLNGAEVDLDKWDEEVWVERDEDWYGVNQSVPTRVVFRQDWINATRKTNTP